jgi:hypothetical protein
MWLMDGIALSFTARSSGQLFDAVEAVGMPRVCNKGRTSYHTYSRLSQVFMKVCRYGGTPGELLFAKRKSIVWSQLICVLGSVCQCVSREYSENLFIVLGKYFAGHFGEGRKDDNGSGFLYDELDVVVGRVRRR